MKSVSLAAVAGLSLPLFFFADFAVAKPAPAPGVVERGLNGHLSGVGRYHRPPMRPAQAVVIDNAATDESVVPQVIVYVDTQGRPISTTTKSIHLIPPPTPTPQSPRAEPQLQRSPPPPNSGPSPSRRNDTQVLIPGVTYSPYNSDGTCKTTSQVISDFQTLAPLYSLIRIYGVDCNQVSAVLSAVRSTSSSSPPSTNTTRLFLGIFNLNDLDSQISTLVSAVTDPSVNPSGWSIIDTISIGNELVNNGQATPQQVLSAVSSARSSLREAGYTGPVVTVDTYLAVTTNPSLCDGSDYCAMNVHPFFDPNTSADQAGNFVLRQIANVREVLADPEQRIVVTESGWPWQGNANGMAVPGRENQEIAVQSIVDKFGGQEGLENLILFTAFNDPWKKAEARTFYAEQFWGMH